MIPTETATGSTGGEQPETGRARGLDASGEGVSPRTNEDTTPTAAALGSTATSSAPAEECHRAKSPTRGSEAAQPASTPLIRWQRARAAQARNPLVLWVSTAVAPRASRSVRWDCRDP